MTSEAIALLAAISYALFTVLRLAWPPIFNAARSDDCVAVGPHGHFMDSGIPPWGHPRIRGPRYGCVRYFGNSSERDEPIELHRIAQDRRFA
jgi:hypothetical protein